MPHCPSCPVLSHLLATSHGLHVGVGSVLPLCGTWGLNLGHQAWQRVPLLFPSALCQSLCFGGGVLRLDRHHPCHSVAKDVLELPQASCLHSLGAACAGVHVLVHVLLLLLCFLFLCLFWGQLFYSPGLRQYSCLSLPRQAFTGMGFHSQCCLFTSV